MPHSAIAGQILHPAAAALCGVLFIRDIFVLTPLYNTKNSPRLSGPLSAGGLFFRMPLCDYIGVYYGNF